MAQITSGIRAILSHPSAYQFFQILVGANKLWRACAEEYIGKTQNCRMLDIGCGTGNLLAALPENIEYTGIDLNQDYIIAAQKRFGSRGTFINDSFQNLVTSPTFQFDIITVTGVLHHLDDKDALQLFDYAKLSLHEGGRMITIDPCWVENQSSIAKFIIRNDRGRNVRSPNAYARIAQQVFINTKVTVRHDILNIPFTHCILECSVV